MSWEEITLVLIFGFFIVEGLRFLHMQSQLPQIKREQMLGVDLSKMPAWKRRQLVNRHLGPEDFSSSIRLVLIVIAGFLVLAILGSEFS